MNDTICIDNVCAFTASYQLKHLALVIVEQVVNGLLFLYYQLTITVFYIPIVCNVAQLPMFTKAYCTES